ncbi:MAG TPA: hypothetical protein VM802_17880 [Chitinophaga sp.]|uniref:hypothetical protein n=1 Tax=Chitinophaga sp. TaxID=1869181 RepID=UPI002C000E91|nr:hypothetical protein [Chitinophaga sp.]HVI46753.1 hypothetical protein [Chitinophaga sp.]
MNIDKAIREFADFLNRSWSVAYPLLIDRDYTSDEDSINDWLQCNWEILVERKVLKLNEYLEVFGEGADFNGASSRITDPNALPNFKVIIRSNSKPGVYDVLNDEVVILKGVSFEKLVGFKDGFYTLEPEFKYVLIIDNDSELERVIPLDGIEFDLERL